MAGTTRAGMGRAERDEGSRYGRAWKLLRKRQRSNRKLRNKHMACAQRKADNKTKVNSQVMIRYAKKRDWDLTEIDWKFIKKQEEVWE